MLGVVVTALIQATIGGAGIFIGFLNNAVANVTTELSGMGDPDNINIVLATATSPQGLPTSFAVYQSLLARGVIGQRLDFNYQMGQAHQPDTLRPEFPGKVRPYFSEDNQMSFYQHWRDLMSADGRKEEQRA